MLVKVFTLLLSFSYVISDGQVRQVSFKIYWVLNMLNVINYIYKETLYYFYH